MIHSVRFKAVLDTNVIYPVIIRDLLLWFANYDLYTPKWSQNIIDEWQTVMERKGVSNEEAVKRVQKIVSIPLKEVVNLVTTDGPNQISRENGKRRVVVQANVRGSDIATFVGSAKRSIDQSLNIPTGYWIEWGVS